MTDRPSLAPKEDRKSRLDEFIANPRRALWSLAAPMMVGYTVHALFVVVDAAFIGRLGEVSLAAATLAGPLFISCLALAIGLSTGITAELARAIGSRDSARADHVASNGLGLCLGLGTGLAIAGLTIGLRMMPVLGATGEISALTWQYFEPLCMAMPLFFISSAFGAVLNGEGDARTPMVVLAIATMLNLILDPVFIFILDLGIRGAALATVAAQAFSLLTFVYLVLIRRRTFSRFRLAQMAPSWHLAAPILLIGMPAAGSILIDTVGMGLYNRVVAGFGDNALAGFGAGTKVEMVVVLPIIGLASALVALGGMYKGAERTDLLRATALHTYRAALSIAIVIGLTAFLASRPVIGLFVSDPEALAIGCRYLSFMVFALPLWAICMTSGRLLQGLGQSLTAMLISVLRVLIIGAPMAYVAVFCFEAPIEAVWVSMIFGGLITIIAAIRWVRRQLWTASAKTS